jgi:predicted SAM-dependent methyltransferase
MKAPPIRLHIGGEQVKEGWKILNAQPLAGVDFVGLCTDLSQFPDASIAEVYASHVYEHLDYAGELQRALKEAFRVLRPGGLFRAAVPDFEALCAVAIDRKQPADVRWMAQRMIMGGQTNAYDYHKVGLWFEVFKAFLENAGFTAVRRVEAFGLFKDASDGTLAGRRISLNVVASKPMG